MHDGFPIGDIGDVGRNLRSIVDLITGGQGIAADSVQIYVRSTAADQRFGLAPAIVHSERK